MATVLAIRDPISVLPSCRCGVVGWVDQLILDHFSEGETYKSELLQGV